MDILSVFPCLASAPPLCPRCRHFDERTPEVPLPGWTRPLDIRVAVVCGTLAAATLGSTMPRGASSLCGSFGYQPECDQPDLWRVTPLQGTRSASTLRVKNQWEATAVERVSLRSISLGAICRMFRPHAPTQRGLWNVKTFLFCCCCCTKRAPTFARVRHRAGRFGYSPKPGLSGTSTPCS